jgi:D-glycero-D-manno-heptose 1,7-bisphosphate phosphatase
MSRPAVFLDRDGTIIEERNYLDRLDQVTLFPWTVDALRLLKRAGFATVVITNQSAVARGFIEESFVHAVQE